MRKGKTGKKYVSKMSQIKNILKARENEKEKRKKREMMSKWMGTLKTKRRLSVNLLLTMGYL